MGERRRQAARSRRRRRPRAVVASLPSSPRWGCPRPRCSAVCSPGWCGPSRSPDAVAVPRRRHRRGAGRLGVSMGSLVDLETLRTVAVNWLPVLAGDRRDARPQPRRRAAAAAAARDQPGDRGVLDDRRGRLRDHRDGPRPRRRRAHGRRPAVPAGAADRRPHAGRGDAWPTAPPTGSGGPAPAADGPGWPAGLLFTVGCAVVGLVVGRLAAAAGGRPARPAGGGRRRRPHRSRSGRGGAGSRRRAPRSW